MEKDRQHLFPRSGSSILVEEAVNICRQYPLPHPPYDTSEDRCYEQCIADDVMPLA